MQSRTLPFDPIAEAHRQWVAHDWAAAAPGMAAITSIMRVHQIFIARVDEVLRPFGLTFAAVRNAYAVALQPARLVAPGQTR